MHSETIQRTPAGRARGPGARLADADDRPGQRDLPRRPARHGQPPGLFRRCGSTGVGRFECARPRALALCAVIFAVQI